MTHNTRIVSLSLSNFRAFRELEIDFHPELTVLVARNGMGKTAVLDGCALAWRYFIDTLSGASSSSGFGRGDIRVSRTPAEQMVDQLPVALHAVAAIRGAETSWSRELARRQGRTTTKTARELADVATSLLSSLSAYADGRLHAAPELPVFAYYGTGRLWNQGRQSKDKRLKAQRLDVQVDAYQDCLDPRSSFHSFATWFERVWRDSQRRTVDGGAADAQPRAWIDAVRTTTDRVLEPAGWAGLAWDFVGNRIVANHVDAGELPVDLLSDGVRNTLGLVADLTHRCVRLNPQFGAAAPQRTSGVVMIDEVDMHLHPGWQQVILGSLRAAFPKIQFIVTTHSPQVLSTVPKECIRVLDDWPDGFVARMPEVQTEGVPAEDILASVMRVESSPDVPIRRDLNRYRALIDDGSHESEEGRRLRSHLDSHFGSHHPEVADLDRLLRFRRAMQRHQMTEGE
jgi:predicted ATP-binding protein involved in virulence